MSVAHTVIGAVEVLNKQYGKPFNAEDQNLLRVMAASSALARSRWRTTETEPLRAMSPPGSFFKAVTASTRSPSSCSEFRQPSSRR